MKPKPLIWESFTKWHHHVIFGDPLMEHYEFVLDIQSGKVSLRVGVGVYDNAQPLRALPRWVKEALVAKLLEKEVLPEAKRTLVEEATCGVLPQLVTKTGSLDEPLIEATICDSISGGADYVNNMPRRLTLRRILLDGKQFVADYTQNENSDCQADRPKERVSPL